MLGADGARAAAHRPRRRHRGRHDQRRGAAGARRDEADQHRAARAARPSTPPPASPPSRSTSAATPARCRAAASSMEAMVALVLADAVLEKFGGDSVRRDPPQRAVLPRRPADPVSGAAAWSSSARPASGKTTVGTALADRARRAVPRHRPRRRGRRRHDRSPTSSSTHGEAHFRALEERGGRRALAEHDGVLALGGGAVTSAGDPRAAGRLRPGGGAVVWLDVDLAVGRQAGRALARPAAAGVNPRAMLRTCSRRAPRSTARSPR